eukprot:8081-Heterococcus_DN1.PRE.2
MSDTLLAYRERMPDATVHVVLLYSCMCAQFRSALHSFKQLPATAQCYHNKLHQCSLSTNKAV